MMSTETPKISDAEWEVMKVLWASAPRTAGEIVEALEGNRDWNPKTVRTLIKRLTEKRAIGYNQTGRVYSYYPLVREEECVQSETRSFLKRIYGGTLRPMLVNFLQDEKLSREDIEELKRILDERKD
ncbi:BlaI/MecI/CopY family transcriptional regulator [Paenibacillus sp. FSL R7-0048]|uniref:BlaI/MecI/CopY family transcriptional regulator n=2 Tax=Paenibacillus TaxID=44249 RepID=UPI0021161464|nr:MULTISPECIES: BlaI/MecI/CopY family transcriptional regulator [Paenibacillus]MDH6427005.1 BlaI family penicillinase repressor [Paenibacillus sp. PastH-4]MDH6443033.1 BlaI family penicillinase repressor [Paenibacillus sp. PastF-4]MDH6526259.1 BlaI family penicillinase repressor [Paenibacillus sp. PastH-3]